jgi:hypothetical protein
MSVDLSRMIGSSTLATILRVSRLSHQFVVGASGRIRMASVVNRLTFWMT